MVIGFNKQFIEPILQGSKVHTIRFDGGKRWCAGMKMHMYTGGRFSKEYRQFAEKKCISTQIVKMWLHGPHNRLILTIDSKVLNNNAQLDSFAIADGFKDWIDFELYWQPIIQKAVTGGFVIYKLLHWTDLTY